MSIASAEARSLLQNREPATGRQFPPLPVTPLSEVGAIVGRVREAQARWAALGFGGRRKRLLAFRRLLADRGEEVALAIHRETGKPRFEALVHEVLPVVHFTGHFARRARRVLRERPLALGLFGPLKKGRIRYEPRGVVGVLAPWNYPFFLPMADALMALAAGNGVVVKPSEWTPRVLLLAKDLLEEAGIDPDLFAVVVGRGDAGQAVIEAEVDMVVFTGSVATGRLVAAACGERLIPCVSELGGKDAAIVLADADVERAARSVAFGGFANGGQICAAVERVLVHESIYPRFVEALAERARSLRQGDDGEVQVDLGPMVMPSQEAVIVGQLADAVQRGARILAGGRAFGAEGARYFEPTVVADVDASSSLWREESFGPCIPVRPFRTEEEAVREVNRSRYGLNAYVFSRDRRASRRIASRLEVGTVMIDDVLYTGALPQAPWGGLKQSGVGRVHGDQGLRDLCDARLVSEPRLPLEPFWAFPYRRSLHRWMLRGIRLLSRLPW